MLKPVAYSRPEAMEVLASSMTVQLICEQEGRFVFVDLHNNLAYYLNRSAFLVGLFFIGTWQPDELSALRDTSGRIAGFTLAELTCLFSTHPDLRPAIPASTRLLATPQGVHVRTAPDRDWITLFWQP